MIGINTYNVFVFDLNDPLKLIKYWFEGYQLWESKIKGFLLSTNDFLMLSKEGMSMIAIGNKKSRCIRDKDNQKRKVHSLGKCNYLKIEESNHIFFSMQFYDDRQICVQEQFKDSSNNTQFDDIFRIKIHEVTLRELMLIQSIFASSVQSDIEVLVNSQPNPTIFFKVFLELDIKSMITYLSFDVKSIRSTLDKKNSKYFSMDYPVFYKNSDGQSAIDECLERNQIRSINLMIDYICQFQNSYVFCHLFEHNLVELINKGVDMENLFNSNVLKHEFAYENWPDMHINETKMREPYNKSIFALRDSYMEIFENNNSLLSL